MPMDIHEPFNQNEASRSSQMDFNQARGNGATNPVPPAGPYVPRDKYGRAYEPCPGCEPKEPGPGTLGHYAAGLSENRAYEERRMREDKEFAEAEYRRQRMGGVGMGAVEAQHSFSIAIENVKFGKAATRAGWNGRGMWIALFKEPALGKRDFIIMKLVDGTTIPWVASQTDLLANDWIIL